MKEGKSTAIPESEEFEGFIYREITRDITSKRLYKNTE
jgi:hypothetical protein